MRKRVRRGAGALRVDQDSSGKDDVDFALYSNVLAPWPEVALPDELEAKLIERLNARDERG